MQIDSNALRLALLKIFMESGVPAGWHAYGSIAAAWQHTGLRVSDLRDAVHEMMEGGELHSAERDGALSLALDADLLHCLAQPNAYLRLGTLQQEVTLLDALFRGSRGADRGLRRRARDVAEQFEDD